MGKRWRVTGGFWLLLGALGVLLSLRVLFWFCVACVVHELGHACAIRLFGGRVAQVRLTGLGAVMEPGRGKLFSYGEESAVALAGPLASLLLALLAAAWGRRFGGTDAFLLTGLSLTLGLFNLLPAGPLDGGRAALAGLSRLTGPDRGELVCGVMTKVTAGLLAAAGLWVFGAGGNFTLLLAALWLAGRWRRG